ncbi:MAG: hypothetical protein ACOY3Y_09595 [Acidobacteriota bacterium]
MRALTREQALSLAKDPSSGAERGAFVCFAMIPVEERIGEWRFAGAAASVGEAFAVLAQFHQALGWKPRRAKSVAEELLAEPALEVWLDAQRAWSAAELPLEGNELVLLAEGQAPFDDVGLCIVKVSSLEASGFAGRAPETELPETWMRLDEE